jgi:hypothetical protein
VSGGRQLGSALDLLESMLDAHAATSAGVNCYFTHVYGGLRRTSQTTFHHNALQFIDAPILSFCYVLRELNILFNTL